MKVTHWLSYLVVVALSAPLTATEPSETPGLVPSDALAMVVVPDLPALEKSVNTLAGKLMEGFEIPDCWNLVLRLPDIQARQRIVTRPDGTQALVDLPTTIDRNKALVLVTLNTPPVDLFSVLMIPVTDYDKFLGEIALLKSTKDDELKVQPTADGFDRIGEPGGDEVFIMKRADYAVLALSPEALSGFKNTKTTLLEIMTPDEKKLLADSDVYAYVNCPQIFQGFKGDLLAARDMWEARMKEVPPKAGAADVPPMVRRMRAKYQALLELGEQLGTGAVGAKISADGVRLTCLNAFRPDTMLGRLAAAQQAQPLPVLSALDADAICAGAIYVTPGSINELVDWYAKYLGETVLVQPEQRLQDVKTSLQKQSRLLTGQIACGVYPGREPGHGAFHMVLFCQTPDPAALNELIINDAGWQETSPSNSGAAGLGTKVTYDKDIEPGIDRVTIKLSSPGGQDDPIRTQKLREMPIPYWEKYVFHFASASSQAGKYSVISFGDWTTETVKKLAGRIQAGTAGPLVQSPAFARATAGLPQRTAGLFYINTLYLAEIGVLADSIKRPATPVPKLTLPSPADASGVGMAVSFSGNTMRTDLLVPISELLNWKQMAFQMAPEFMSGGQGHP